LEASQRRWCRRATAARRSLRIGEGRIANADQQIRAEPYNAARIAQHPTLFFGPPSRDNSVVPAGASGTIRIVGTYDGRSVRVTYRVGAIAQSSSWLAVIHRR
jgi:hypothetical protein